MLVGFVRLGYVRLGIRDWEDATSFFLNIKKWMIGSNFDFGSMCKLLDQTIQLLGARK